MSDMIESFGKTVRDTRENKGFPFRQFAALLEGDTAFLSKMERSEKITSRQQVRKLAEEFGTTEKELMTLWLSDKILENIKNSKQKK